MMWVSDVNTARHYCYWLLLLLWVSGEWVMSTRLVTTATGYYYYCEWVSEWVSDVNTARHYCYWLLLLLWVSEWVSDVNTARHYCYWLLLLLWVSEWLSEWCQHGSSLLLLATTTTVSDWVSEWQCVAMFELTLKSSFDSVSCFWCQHDSSCYTAARWRYNGWLEKIDQT